MTLLLTWLFISVGALLVIAASALHATHPLPSTILEHLGVTLASVFAIKLVYERFVAGQQFEHFRALLHAELEKLQSFTTILALGIKETFLTRTAFIERHGLERLVSSAASGTRLKVVGASMFHLMNQTAELQRALTKGMNLELCFLDPPAHTQQVERLTEMYRGDVESSVEQARRLVAELTKAPPQGSLEIRTHSLVLFDSLMLVQGPDTSTLVWDLSFGRDLSQKRILMLDATKPLARDLSIRFNRIWDNAQVRVLFRNGGVEKNDWK